MAPPYLKKGPGATREGGYLFWGSAYKTNLIIGFITPPATPLQPLCNPKGVAEGLQGGTFKRVAEVDRANYAAFFNKIWGPPVFYAEHRRSMPTPVLYTALRYRRTTSLIWSYMVWALPIPYKTNPKGVAGGLLQPFRVGLLCSA
jgi:hypothetical protein